MSEDWEALFKTATPGEGQMFWKRAACTHADQIRDPEDPEGYAICASCGAHVELDLDAILLRGFAALLRTIDTPIDTDAQPQADRVDERANANGEGVA